MNRQRGQSMTEFAVCASALVVLMLGTWTIGGYQELQRRAIVASRQAAHEGMWLTGRNSIEAQRTHMADAHFDDPALVDPTGRTRMVSAASVDLRAVSGEVPGYSADASRLMLEPLRTAAGFLGVSFDLDGGGFRSGVISLRTQALPGLPVPLDTLELRFAQPFALLSDGWNASGPSHVESRVGGLVPAARLRDLSRHWASLSVPLGLVEPSLREFCPGLIEVDRIPEDRLGPGPAQPLPVCP